ncbi:MAG: hypothetical protein MR598_03435 [Erysipelotrichaceae bacterium]|nr:hypothetical protein [Erysipelotrichaceae bacterium]
MAFNQKEYINNYKKENYKTFKVEMQKQEKEHLDNLLKEKNLKGAEFLRLSIKALENGTLKKEEEDN